MKRKHKTKDVVSRGGRDRRALSPSGNTASVAKLLKYPTTFNSAGVAVLTKMDLAAAVEFDSVAANHSIQSVRPGMAILDVSAKSSVGMDAYLDFLRSRRAAARAIAAPRDVGAFTSSD